MIKLFEHYNEYYTEISSNIYYKKFDDRLILNENEINEINNFFDSWTKYNYIKYIEYTIWIQSDYKEICLYKISDEWYYIRFYFSEYEAYTDKIKSEIYKYYKCDQLEGLIKCLEKLIYKP